MGSERRLGNAWETGIEMEGSRDIDESFAWLDFESPSDVSSRPTKLCAKLHGQKCSWKPVAAGEGERS